VILNNEDNPAGRDDYTPLNPNLDDKWDEYCSNYHEFINESCFQALLCREKDIINNFEFDDLAAAIEYATTALSAAKLFNAIVPKTSLQKARMLKFQHTKKELEQLLSELNHVYTRFQENDDKIVSIH
jgi:hypothetical protein